MSLEKMNSMFQKIFFPILAAVFCPKKRLRQKYCFAPLSPN